MTAAHLTYRMRVAVALAFFAGVLSSASQVLLKERPQPTPGEWSGNGVYLGYGLGALDRPGEIRTRRIPSPDGNKAILIGNNLLLTVEANGQTLPLESTYLATPLSEVLWSPDSSAFAVTQSNGGWVGSWDIQVFLTDDNTVKRASVTETAKKDAMGKYKCLIPEKPAANEEPNTGAVHWLDGSSRLLIVAEVPPHSSCADMGKLFGYVVSIPSGKIVNRYQEGELRQGWEIGRAHV